MDGDFCLAVQEETGGGQNLQRGQVTRCVSLHTSAEAVEESFNYTT